MIEDPMYSATETMVSIREHEEMVHHFENLLESQLREITLLRKQAAAHQAVIDALHRLVEAHETYAKPE